MERVDGSYKSYNGTKRYLGPTFMIYFLNGLEKMRWEAYFSAEVGVGILYMKPGCVGKGMQTSCIEAVRMLNFANILHYNPESYCSEFWEAFRNLTSVTLGGYNSSLNLKSNGKDSEQFFGLYMREMLNNTGLTSLTLKDFNFNYGDNRKIIQKMPLLKFLDLSNNSLVHYKIGFLKEAPNLEHLDLSFNKLEVIPQVISSLHDLKYLDISNNPINFINFEISEVLGSLMNMKALILSHTHLNSPSNLAELWRNNSSILLKLLDVSYCNLTSLKGSDFLQRQTLLESFNISGNEIDVLPRNFFVNFKHLKKVGISNLNLTRAPRLELGFNRVLETIDLSHNRLTTPEDILISGKVNNLDLSFNLIKVWDDEAIFSLDTCWQPVPKCNSSEYHEVWVENLNLSYNLMPTVTKTMARTLMNLEVVDIGGNPFSCSHCEIDEFANWARQMENNSADVEIFSLGVKNNLRCKVDGSDNSTLLRDIWKLPDACSYGRYWVIIFSVLGVFLVFFVLIVAMVIRYKFEIQYVMFMLRQKRKWKSPEQRKGFEYDAFVCYSRHDRGWVMQEMVPTLEDCDERFRLCLHERDFILGSFISLNIIQSIQKSRFTVLVLSKGFVHSQWCRWELEVANYKLFESGRELLILIELERLAEDLIPRHLKFLMDTRTYLEWPEKGEDAAIAWRRLKKSLGKSIHQQEKEVALQAASTETIL